MNKAYIFSLALVGSPLLTGCGEVQVYDVDTKFSNVVQVEPVSKARRSVFLSIKDVTGYASELATSIDQQLKIEGYTVVADPDTATYKLMVSVIKFGCGTSDDEITYMQAINPSKSAELAIEKNRVKRTRRSANVYENDEVVEESFIRSFADRVGIADVEIIKQSGKSLKTRLMVGVNMRGGLFKAAKPEVERFGWTRLIQRLSSAISGMF